MPEAGINFDWVIQKKNETCRKEPPLVDWGENLKDWSVLATGASGDIEIEKGWLRVAQELFTLFCKKQHDYGATNIAVGGLDGVAIRVSDKVSRLWKLLGLGAYRGKGEPPALGDESLRDTLLDLADYGIIACLVEDGIWKTMTLEEAWKDEPDKTV